MADVERKRMLDFMNDYSEEVVVDTNSLRMTTSTHAPLSHEEALFSNEHGNQKPSFTMSADALEGDITVPGLSSALNTAEQQEFNTLDEPIKDTILRDLKAIGSKFLHVLYPKESKMLLREWDLWGPLILCVFLAMMLHSSADSANSSNDGGPQFAEVFVIYWLGASIVTLNIKLLGGSISFFQSVCVLGYCVLPLAAALIVCQLILIASQTIWLFVVRCVIVMAAFGWSTFASTAFLAESQPPHRKALAVYPIFLFYFFISWLVLSHS